MRRGPIDGFASVCQPLLVRSCIPLLRRVLGAVLDSAVRAEARPSGMVLAVLTALARSGLPELEGLAARHTVGLHLRFAQHPLADGDHDDFERERSVGASLALAPLSTSLSPLGPAL